MNRQSRSVTQEKSIQVLPLVDCLAKTCRLADGSVVPGLNVSAHCQIVGMVARELMRRMPDFLKSELFPFGSELIAASHDLGKVSPTFQAKIYGATEAYESSEVPELSDVNPNLERDWGGHAGTSQAALDGIGKYLAEIAGRHHGRSPNIMSLPLACGESIGGESWQQLRMELLEVLKKTFAVDFPKVKNHLHADVLTGLTTVSDWIGSGSFFDKYKSDGSVNDAWNQKISEAVDLAGYVSPKLTLGLEFSGLFGFEPRPAQVQLFESIKGPGVYVLEAPMGMGKTEAGLFAAYQAMAESRATGVYFALPTQLTSNKIHDRLQSFLKSILVKDCIHRRALLLHGSAWLRETEMGEDGEPGRSWFDGSKRGILAPFAVGTIDQALMAVMNVKHGFVRTFGLAGKVVILDEVHTYDSYTGTIMDQLVAALRELQCTVIILSATLTTERRNVLLGLQNNQSQNQSYPLISALPNHSELIESAVEILEEREYQIQIQDDEQLALDEALHRAELGQQVLWIENTVASAQETYKTIAAKELDIEVGLLHSRFLRLDREKNESQWVGLFGKDGQGTRYQQGRILVGTQVLEQSLDIDADFLVTRICPTDMLFQRLGRLWRHRQNDTHRPKDCACEAWILSPCLDKACQNPEKYLGNTAKVYAPYVLCRTIEVWQTLEVVSLPKQIRPLLELTYAPREDVDQMAKYHFNLRQDQEKLSRLARIGLSKSCQTLPESKASTRHSDQESCEVLLLQSWLKKDDDLELQFLDGQKVLLQPNAKSKDRKLWLASAVTISKNMLQVPVHHAPKASSSSAYGLLGQYVYVGQTDEQETQLRVAIVRTDDGLVSLDGGASNDRWLLEYNPAKGYQVVKNTNTSEFENEGW